MSGAPSKRGCPTIFREEFRVANFGLSHHTPKWIASDQWGWRIFYLVWRVFWALFHLSFLIYDQATFTPRTGVYYVFLTKWTYIVLVYNLVYQAVVVVYLTCRPRQFQDGQSPWFLKTTWFLYELSTTANIGLTIIYYALIFEGRVTLLNTIQHVVNSVYVLLDLCVTGMPVRLLHCVYPMAYAAVYVIFTAIYWAAGGVDRKGRPYIYEALDWNRPETAAPYAVCLTLIGVPLIHCFVWALHILRRFIYESRCASNIGDRNEDAVTEGSGSKPSNLVTPV